MQARANYPGGKMPEAFHAVWLFGGVAFWLQSFGPDRHRAA